MPEAAVESLVSSANVDAVIVMGVVGALSESRRAVSQIEYLQRWDDPTTPEIETGPEGCEPPEPELSERELDFIREVAGLMDHYRKPIANISFKPMTQAIYSVGGRYSTFVLPSPLRAVRILGKMAGYSAHLQKHGRGLDS